MYKIARKFSPSKEPLDVGMGTTIGLSTTMKLMTVNEEENTSLVRCCVWEGDLNQLIKSVVAVQVSVSLEIWLVLKLS